MMRAVSLDDCYRNLAVAVVKQAVDDMEYELKKSNGFEREAVKSKWKKWWKSDYVCLLINADGGSIYNQLIDNFNKTGGVKLCPYGSKSDNYISKLSKKEKMELREELRKEGEDWDQ